MRCTTTFAKPGHKDQRFLPTRPELVPGHSPLPVFLSQTPPRDWRSGDICLLQSSSRVPCILPGSPKHAPWSGEALTRRGLPARGGLGRPGSRVVPLGSSGHHARSSPACRAAWGFSWGSWLRTWAWRVAICFSRFRLASSSSSSCSLKEFFSSSTCFSFVLRLSFCRFSSCSSSYSEDTQCQGPEVPTPSKGGMSWSPDSGDSRQRPGGEAGGPREPADAGADPLCQESRGLSATAAGTSPPA